MDNLPVKSSQSLLEALQEIQGEIEDLPPVPRGILAHWDVPPGGGFRQWDTRGQLWVWVNRVQMEWAIKGSADRDQPGHRGTFLWGIDVYMIDRTA